MNSITDCPDRSQYNGLSDSFLLTCGGIESVACHPKAVVLDRSAQTRQVQLNTPAPAYTCIHHRIQLVVGDNFKRLKADFRPDLSPTLHVFNISECLRGLYINHCSAGSRVQQPHCACVMSTLLTVRGWGWGSESGL